MNASQVRDLIVIPALKELGMHSLPAEKLVMATWAHESMGGTYIKQFPTGPARGMFQMEPATLRDLYNNFLCSHPLWREILGALNVDRLVYDMRYAAMACRLQYYRQPGAIPDDWNGIADYWKTRYNSHLGRGTVSKFLFDKDKYLKGLY